MLTRLSIRDFKQFADVEIELGRSVVFVGPNNSGKTSALQALALWDVGLRKWREKRAGKSAPEKRPGVTIGRRDLIAIPVPVAKLLWRDLHVRRGVRQDGRAQTPNVLIRIVVEGVTQGRPWSCGLEFDYANDESFYCRPLWEGNAESGARKPVPEDASTTRVAFLPPMSGLAATEPRWDPGRVNVLIGEGQTAQVLRNLCYAIHQSSEGPKDWDDLVRRVRKLFGVELLPPAFVQERGEITMAYREPSGVELDLSCSGRGLQQTLLLLAHLYSNPGTVLLLDEPDAHLEILRQREIYDLMTDLAAAKGSQIVAATHSEVVLGAAADRDIVIAFVGKPHRIDDRRMQQVFKALRDIGYDQYLLAEQVGWVLYVEGETDLKILKALARTVAHPAADVLERAFVHVVGSNVPQQARDHFFGLREAKQDLVGFALFDRIEKELHRASPLVERMWSRREIENYVCNEAALVAYAVHEQPDDLFGSAETGRRRTAMLDSITEVSQALKTLKRGSPWSPDLCASTEVLDLVFEKYFERIGVPNLMRKSDYHELAALVPRELVDPEVVEMLDAIVQVSKRAAPRRE